MLKGCLSIPGGPEVEVDGLVDSGCDSSVLPERIASELGIDLASEARRIPYGGVGFRMPQVDAPFRGMYVAPVALQMRLSELDEVHAAMWISATFLSGEEDAVWGRNDLFEWFDISFRQTAHQLVLRVR